MRYQHAALLVTTVCDRRCPECCYRLPQGQLGRPQHYGWPYFVTAARWLHDLDSLTVSGGEPTLHPLFGRIAREFRALFQPRDLHLATNGKRLRYHEALVDYFDRVVCSDYGDPETRAELQWVDLHHPGTLEIITSCHTPLRQVGGGRACERNTVAAYANGRLYPCCVAPGIPGAASMAPTDDWRERLAELPLSCAACIFSEGENEVCLPRQAGLTA